MYRPKKRPPRSLVSVGVGLRKGAVEKTLQLSRNVQHEPGSLNWTLPPRDGLEIFVGAKGDVVFRQEIYSTKSEIVLHPDEARELLTTLPHTIKAARRQRRAR